MSQIKEINEIKERMENASYGRWKVYRNEDGVCIGTEENHPQLKAPVPVVGIAIRATEPKRHIYISNENADFIANSHSDIDFLLKQIERYEQFIRACRFAGEGGLPQLRKEANYLIKGETASADLPKILRRE